jgi:AcrR family transcriptional regulator
LAVITKRRISSEARREKIIEAAQRVFADKGFHGTTTRELAGEACVSEALLFKHFPNKEAIYKAMLAHCHESEVGGEVRRLLELEPSTSTLAIMLHFLVTKFVTGNEHARMIHHLIMRSMSEDGEYARVIFKHVGETWVPKISECIDVAHKAGDIRGSAEKLKSGAWLTQHLLLMIAFMFVPDKRLTNYKVSDETFTEEAVIFCLRGMGVKDEAIKRHYNPKALALLAFASE